MLVLRDADLRPRGRGRRTRRASPTPGSCACRPSGSSSPTRSTTGSSTPSVARRAMTLGASLRLGVDMGSLISQVQLDAVTAHVETPSPRARRSSPAAGAPRPRAVLLRADRDRGRLARHGVLRHRDLRPGRRALPLPQRGRGRRPRQRRHLRPERRDLHPGRRPRPRARRPDQVRHGQRQRAVRRRPSAASTRRWAACASRAWVAARARRASCATPRRSPWPPSGYPDRADARHVEETYATVMTRALRPLNNGPP